MPRRRSTQNQQAKQPKEEMPADIVRRLIGTVEEYRLKNPGKQIKWKIILELSRLNLEKYTAWQLMDKCSNLKKSHNVTTLDDYERWLAQRKPRRKRVLVPSALSMRPKSTQKKQKNQKREEMPTHIVRRLLGTIEEYRLKFTGKQIKWKIVLDLSRLYNENYKARQLQDKYHNLKTTHNVYTLDDYDKWLDKPNPPSKRVRARLEFPASNLAIPRTVADNMNHEELTKVNPEVVMKSDLELVSKVVHGPVLLSKELFNYIGANTNVVYRTFLDLAKPIVRTAFASHPISEFNHSGRSLVVTDMEKLRARFGTIFDRKKDFPTNQDFQEHIHAETARSSREAHSQRLGSDVESDNDDYCFDANRLGENDFEDQHSSSENVNEVQEVPIVVDAVMSEVVLPGLSLQNSFFSPASQIGTSSVDAVMNEVVPPGVSSQSSSSPEASSLESTASSLHVLAHSIGKISSQVDVRPSSEQESSEVPKKKRRVDSEPLTRTVKSQCYEMETTELPEGCVAMFPNRSLIDEEWQMVLKTKRDFTRMTDVEWTSLLENLKIQCVKTGKQIMDDFYCMLVPRIRDHIFGSPGKQTKVFLGIQHRYAVVVIYHSIQTADMEGDKRISYGGIANCIQNLIDAGILDATVTVQNWQREFLGKLFTKSCDYFCTGENSFNDFVLALTD